MGIVGSQENLVSGNGDTTVSAGGGSSANAFRSCTLIMPKRTAAARVKGIHLVDRAHVHDSVDHHRRGLQFTRVAYGIDPHRREPAGIGWSDLRRRAVAIAHRVAVVAGPILLRGHSTIPVPGCFAQQMYLLVFTEYLHAGSGAVELRTGEAAAAIQLYRHPRHFFAARRAQ